MIFRMAPVMALGLTGLGVAFTGSQYRVGALTAMGPGFAPVALGAGLALLALLLFWFERRATAPLPSLPLRPVLCVGAGILAWALLADRFGFLPAGVAQLLLTSLALPQPSWRRTVVGVLVMTLAAYGLFVGLLGLPLAAFRF